MLFEVRPGVCYWMCKRGEIHSVMSQLEKSLAPIDEPEWYPEFVLMSLTGDEATKLCKAGYNLKADIEDDMKKLKASPVDTTRRAIAREQDEVRGKLKVLDTDSCSYLSDLGRRLALDTAEEYEYDWPELYKAILLDRSVTKEQKVEIAKDMQGWLDKILEPTLRDLSALLAC